MAPVLPKNRHIAHRRQKARKSSGPIAVIIIAAVIVVIIVVVIIIVVIVVVIRRININPLFPSLPPLNVPGFVTHTHMDAVTVTSRVSKGAPIG